MPQVAAGTIAGTIASALSLGATAALVAEVVLTAVFTWGLGRISHHLAGRANRNRASTQSGRTFTVRGTIEPMQLVYGEVRVPGFLVWYGTSPAIFTNNFGPNRYLHVIIAYAAHQCEAITDVWLDSRRVADADIAVDGEVTHPDFYDDGSKLYVRRFLGTKAQAEDTAFLVSNGLYSLITGNFRGAGVAYVHYRLEKSDKVYPKGAPQNFYALVKGRRVYDPRKDSTNGGSGPHRYNDATTWEWSNNPTLCRRDYITGGSRWYDHPTPEPRLGFGDSNARINDAYVIAAANIDDQNVSIPDGSGGSTTQKRYTCDTQLSCGDTHIDNLEILNSSCAGTVSYVNGQYRIFSGAYDVPEVDLTEDDILGPVNISTHPVGEDLYNFVTGTFFDETRDWSESPFPNITNASYEADDGGQFQRTIRLPATRTSYRAQRIGILHLAQSRNKIVVEFERLSLKAMQIAQNDTFTVTIPEYGWDEKVFRCLTWEWLVDGFVRIKAREESSSAYADPAVEDYAEPGEATVDTPQLDMPDTPLSLEAVPLREGIYFKWTMPTPEDPRTIFRLYEHTASTPFSSATEVWSGNSKSVVLERPGQSVRYYWIVAELNGRQSEEYPVGAGLAAAPFVQGLEETFHDSFEHQDYARFYDLRGGSPTVTYPTNGENGGRVLRFEGYGWIVSNRNIPYDTNALYLMTVRARMVTAPTDPSRARFYAGVEGVAADGTTRINRAGADSSSSQHYFTASAFDFGGVSLGTWQTFRGYVSGISGTPSPFPANDITDPAEMFTGVRFIRPLVILNYNNGDGVMEVDYIKLEKVITGPQLEPEVATELIFTSAQQISGNSRDTTNYWILNTVVDSGGTPLQSAGSSTVFTGVMPFDCIAIITANFNASASLGSVTVYPYLRNTGSGVVNTGATYGFHTLTSTLQPGMVHGQFDLVKGQSYEIGVKKLASAINEEVWKEPISVNIEFIKK